MKKATSLGNDVARRAAASRVTKPSTFDNPEIWESRDHGGKKKYAEQTFENNAPRGSELMRKFFFCEYFVVEMIKTRASCLCGEGRLVFHAWLLPVW